MMINPDRKYYTKVRLTDPYPTVFPNVLPNKNTSRNGFVKFDNKLLRDTANRSMSFVSRWSAFAIRESMLLIW